MRSTGRSGTNEDLSELTKNQVEMDRIRAEEEAVFETASPDTGKVKTTSV